VPDPTVCPARLAGGHTTNQAVQPFLVVVLEVYLRPQAAAHAGVAKFTGSVMAQNMGGIVRERTRTEAYSRSVTRFNAIQLNMATKVMIKRAPMRSLGPTF
jgi:hypothetical protein